MRSKFTQMLTLLLAFIVQVSWAQEKTITGNVTDPQGWPLPGVNIVVKGTTTGTQTDFDGNYSITAGVGQVLQFTYVGMSSEERTVGNSNVMNLQMTEDAQALEEVVVTAYGVQKKESLTGSVSEIKAQEIADIQTSNAVQGLAGKVAGVQIVQASGQPGAAPMIRFRGIGSINSSSEPLYVVDGIPFSGDINSINNQDIESMSFLKDASAAALYGNRGANGVIIITTKKGKKERMSVTVDLRAGFNSRAVPEYNIITDPGAYYEGYWQAIRNDMMFNEGMSREAAGQYASENIISSADGSFGMPLGYNNYLNVPNNQVVDPATGRVDPNNRLKYRDSWEDELYGTKFFTQSYISISQGTEKSSQLFSIGYEKNDGFVINSGFEKITARFNGDVQVTDWLKMGGSLAYAHTRQKFVDGGDGSSAYSNPISWSRQVAPIYPIYGYDNQGGKIYDSAGNHVYDDGTGAYGLPQRPYGNLQNPVATALLDIKRNTHDNVFGNAFTEFRIVDGLKFTYNVSVDLRNGSMINFDTPLYGDAFRPNGRGRSSTTRNMAVTHQQLLNYQKQFGAHSIEVLLGHESYELSTRVLQLHKTNFLSPDGAFLDWGVTYQNDRNYERNYNVEGYFSRFMYDYDGRYYLNASIRRDASSVFAPDNKWGTFYGLGGAWRISQEGFMANATWLSELKLKASYGEQGNDALFYPGASMNPNIAIYDPIALGRNYYAYQDQWGVVNNNGELSIDLEHLGNRDITWEKNANFNVGFELGMFDNRIRIDAEYFERKVSDMLFNRPMSLATGNPPFPENIGDMQNRGVEASLDAAIIRNRDFEFGLHLNATHYRNKITRLYNGEPVVDGNFRLEEGRSRYSYFMREFAGVNPDNGAALWYMDVADANGNVSKQTTDNFSQATLYTIGKDAIPDLYGGFSTNFRYKNIDLTVDFAYQIGGYGMDNVYWGLFNASGDAGRNLHKDAVSKTWSPDNTTAEIPRIDTNQPNMHNVSDIRLIDASYLSLQNVSLGYTFGSSFLEAAGMESLRVYALGNNLALWSKRKGYDPRLSMTGASLNGYSILSTVSLGLNLKF